MPTLVGWEAPGCCGPLLDPTDSPSALGRSVDSPTGSPCYTAWRLGGLLPPATLVARLTAPVAARGGDHPGTRSRSVCSPSYY